MGKLGAFVKKVFLLGIIFLLLATGLCFSKEVKLTTIIPSQETLRAKRGVVGDYDWDGDGTIDDDEKYLSLPIADIGDDNLLVGGSVGIGTDASGIVSSFPLDGWPAPKVVIYNDEQPMIMLKDDRGNEAMIRIDTNLSNPDDADCSFKFHFTDTSGNLDKVMKIKRNGDVKIYGDFEAHNNENPDIKLTAREAGDDYREFKIQLDTAGTGNPRSGEDVEFYFPTDADGDRFMKVDLEGDVKFDEDVKVEGDLSLIADGEAPTREREFRIRIDIESNEVDDNLKFYFPVYDKDVSANSVKFMRVDKDANVKIYKDLRVVGGFDASDITFQKNGKKLWRMFEDEDGLYVESLQTGKVYTFVLKEVDK